MKSKRQKKILELIQQRVISTQDELVEVLFQEGLNVTQATVSRDIKELGLIKVLVGNETYKYALPLEQANIPESRLRFILQEFVISWQDSENLIVIKTPPGNAHAVASVLDNAQWDEVIGTIAGDDTILLIIKNREDVTKVLKRITTYIEA